jgi:4-diphosphocytidyl-2-C-methyl-D-erythritol kinase
VVYEIDAHAKVNLALDVLKKREDGYHEIRSIMQEISLCDKLIFKEIKTGFKLHTNNKNLSVDKSNLVYKAYEKMAHIANTNVGVEVEIIKNIPLSAGLAGGSTNAAATLLMLNEIWRLGLPLEKLMQIGEELGSDVAFCLVGGTKLAEGKGERLKEVKPFKNKHILVVNPGFEISTPYVYSKIKIDNKRIDIEGLIKAIEADDLFSVANKLENKMEEVVFKEFPIIRDIKDYMLKNGAIGALMSGSGASVFAIYEDVEKLEHTKGKMEKIYPYCFHTLTI